MPPFIKQICFAIAEGGGDTAEVLPTPAPSLITAPPVEAPAPAPVTIESLTLPEGAQVDPDAATAFLGLINDQKLTRAELAQKIVDMQINLSEKGTSAAQTAAATLWESTQSDWQKAVTALPEIGGRNLAQSLATIKSGLEKAGATKATFEALDLTGAGNHPEVVRILHALTKPLAEGRQIGGNAPAGSLSQADRLYANTKET